jgi:hypothetical protein
MCALECGYIYPDKDWVTYTTTTFSERGDLLEQRHRNPDGSQWVIICHYDDLGRVSQKEQRGSEAEQVFSYHYDAVGRLERVVAHSQTGAERVCESYQHDLAGQKVVTVYPDPVFRGKISVDIEAAFETSIEASSILTIFDEWDRPVKRVFYDPNGRVDRRILMRYDIAGRLIEEGELEAEGKIREDLRHLYRYDATGRLIEKTMRHHALGIHRKTFAYNGHGDVVEELHQRTAGILDHDHDQDWKTQYHHQYDNRGNWIERVAEIVLKAEDPKMSVVERRSLDYY